MKKFLYNKKILLYTGYQNKPWCPESFSTEGMGGTETAVYNLSKCFKNLGYEVIVGGDVIEGDYDGVKYRTNRSLHECFSGEHFRAIIATSYVHFIKEFSEFTFDKSFFCVHNTEETGGWWYPWWREGDLANQCLELLQSDFLTNVVCLTPWHGAAFSSAFPSLADKVKIVGNGFDSELIPEWLDERPREKFKVPRSFIYSSHAERGLHLLLSKWHLIREKKPDATLKVCTPEYGLEYFHNLIKPFKGLEEEGVSFMGAIDQESLYKIIIETDYWLYPSKYEETYCITALEMQAMKTCVLTSNFSALKDTVANRGILVDVEEDDDFFFFQFLNHFLYLEAQAEDKKKMIDRAYEWSVTQSWSHRAREWSKLIEFN